MIITTEVIIQSGDCFNAGFETGNIGGWQPSYGFIDDLGNVSFDTEMEHPSQHEIMSIEDGFDPIANLFCFENKLLPVVPQGVGRHTLRLGDKEVGSRTSKVVITFEVTPNVSFFLLKYAVVLDDPNHEVFEQPRFEMQIKDENGDLLDCGIYQVRAAANLEGFESCGSWRVRPWTTAGFELQSYIGQTINIELFTTDCSRGGHGGYAYIDASCRPLELILDGYCPDSSSARYIVTEGFESYEWNTGHTTSVLDIDNPVPGTEYQVTVTSSTGCTLVLKDTLPMIDQLEPSFFDPSSNLTVDLCAGDEYIYTPTGTNIGFVEALELGYGAETFTLSPVTSQTIHFVTHDNFGCEYDTAIVQLNVINLDGVLDIKHPCQFNNNGIVHIEPISASPNVGVSLNGGPHTNTLIFENLPPGQHTFELLDGNGCTFTFSALLEEKLNPNTTHIVKPATCDDENGIIVFTDFDFSSLTSINRSVFSPQSIYNDLDTGYHKIVVMNQSGCLDSTLTFVDYTPPPEIEIVQIDSVYCDQENGKVHSIVSSGFGEKVLAVDGGPTQSSTTFTNLKKGSHKIEVRDESGCIVSKDFEIPSTLFAEIKEVTTEPINCRLNNGVINLTFSNPSLVTDIILDNNKVTNTTITNLAKGSYTVKIIDRNECLDSAVTTIGGIPPPEINNIIFIDGDCNGNSSVQINASSGLKPYSYRVNSEKVFHDPLIHNLPPGMKTLTIYDDTGCSTDTLLIIPDSEKFVYPNIFSPNGDRINDEFCIIASDHIRELLEFSVYNRWGNLVYQSDDHLVSEHICWDGYYNNTRVKAGVYVYIIKIRLIDGKLICRNGDVTISE